jgi:signal transduction histidine kinase
MDGIEAARRIRELCPTPVVVLTAYETPELVAQAGAAGVGAYLIKPPNAQELERAITIARTRFNDMMRLHRLNTELQARNDDLDTFAHTVAHDLQSPLGLIIGFADFLQGESELTEESVEYLEAMIKNGRKMKNIISELQLLAGVRRADVTLKPLDMAEIVAESQQRLAYMIKEHQAEIILPEEPWPTALGYASWVEEVWVNYLSNGIKYGGRPPRLELGATARPDGMVRFWVRDNGPGLTLEEQNRLFVPFTQLDQVRARGHGLGLSIVRRIIEKLGGQVGVESEAVPGRGSIFSFTLPEATCL